MRPTDSQTGIHAPQTFRPQVQPPSPPTPLYPHYSRPLPVARASFDDGIVMSRKTGSPPMAVGMPRHSSLDPSSTPRMNGVPHLSTSVSTTSSSSSSASSSPSSFSQFTWLVFLGEKWIPFDTSNQMKLEQTLSLGGTFVDITDSHFKHVKRVRVFPKTSYLSYLGVKYRLSRIMEPDARLDCSDYRRESISYQDSLRCEERSSR